MTVRQLYCNAKRQLKESGVENPAFEAALIFEKHLGIGRGQLPTTFNRETAVPEGFFEDIIRRKNGEPLQYILGEWEFMGYPFLVGPGVLIPRPDTEILVQVAIAFLKGKSTPKVLELCFGSGCIGISTALFCPSVCVKGLDISEKALCYAHRNIARHQLGKRVEAVRGDMVTGPRETSFPMYDALLCNPPYIRTDEIPMLDRSVQDYEPKLALDGGRDGLLFYRAAGKWLPLLKSGGMAVFEVGYTQAEEVAEILRREGLQSVFIHKDYAGIDRVVGGYKV